jgi:DNA repair protein RadD
MKLRPYQTAAVAAIYKYWENSANSGLVVLPTGTGKSLIVAEVCKLTKEYPQTRIIVATHTREIIAQNFQKLIHAWPDAPAGIYSAGMNKRDTHHKILFVGIQSVYNKAFVLQRCDILIVDECHSIGRESLSMWGRFIADLKTINTHMRVLGCTATPYRLDSGNLTEGEDSLFKEIAYEYGILEAVRDGYLCEIVPKSMATKLDVSSVHKRGGEFIESELQAAVNVDEAESITQGL